MHIADTWLFYTKEQYSKLYGLSLASLMMYDPEVNK